MAFFAISDRHPLRLLSAADLAMEHERLLEENAQLHQAVSSHARIDQAMGAVVAIGRIAPEEAWRALRDVSQRTNTKLRVVAEAILRYAQDGVLPEPILIELDKALERYRICSHPTGNRSQPAGGQSHSTAARPPSTGTRSHPAQSTDRGTAPTAPSPARPSPRRPSRP
ncbi:ANTAR domain-containing protein [Streptomyces sp. NPDC004393]|uniref:ANTAR domain-containing protein n=1 Tax=Streptomyces sp. NPDC004533 TaxID=3154278 RepID=UPI0033B5C30E